MIPYNHYDYSFPPRPEEDHRVPPFRLDQKEAQGYWAEAKLNGTCNVMTIDPAHNIIAMTRHRTAHKAWQPDANTPRAFLDLPPGWYTFVCELMHSKVPGLRNINYINDVLVAGSENLVGKTFAERRQILLDLFPNRTEHISGMYYLIDANTWLARTYTKNFGALFERWTKLPMCEGLVMKDPRAKLAYCFKPNSNVKWLFKCRRASKTYEY